MVYKSGDDDELAWVEWIVLRRVIWTWLTKWVGVYSRDWVMHIEKGQFVILREEDANGWATVMSSDDFSVFLAVSVST